MSHLGGVENRGVPERIRTFDLLICGHNAEEQSILFPRDPGRKEGRGDSKDDSGGFVVRTLSTRRGLNRPSSDHDRLNLETMEKRKRSRRDEELFDGWQTATECGDIPEMWAQSYVLKNYKKLGFTKIRGPHSIGPDFEGVYKRKTTLIEVETVPKNYIFHGHHKDRRFHRVDILILLSARKVPENLRDRLPDRILHIDIPHFMKWAYPELKKSQMLEHFNKLMVFLAEEFKRRYAESCIDKERSMAACPECSLCPYFGEGSDLDSDSFIDSHIPSPGRVWRQIQKLYE